MHRHHRPVAAVDPLNLARDKAVRHIVRARAAVFFRYRHAQQAIRAHFAEYLGVCFFVQIGAFDPRQQLVRSKGLRRIADHAFIFCQLVIQQKRIIPVERLTFVRRI